MKKTVKKKSGKEVEKISRKEALKKAGKYVAFTAAATLLILSPKDSQASSTEPEGPGW